MPALVGVVEMVVMVVLCEIVCMVYGISAWPVFLLPISFCSLTIHPRIHLIFLLLLFGYFWAFIGLFL